MPHEIGIFWYCFLGNMLDFLALDSGMLSYIALKIWCIMQLSV